MAFGCLAEKLSAFVPLTADEQGTLDRLEERERQLRRGMLAVRENDRSGELFVVKKGMLMSYLLLDDGSRQILRFLFRGDLVGGTSLAYRKSPESVVALSDAVIAPLEREAFARVLVEHPRLGALISVYGQVERVALIDRLAGLGRTPAKARVAGVLIELRNRMRRADHNVRDTFAIGLTQEEIGDATGLTAVHVNRMLRQLEDEGAIERHHGRVTIRDEAALLGTANFTDRYAGLDLGWLPSSR